MVKKIHYCWFGGKKLPKSVKKCINTWKKMLPDYEIKEWNESNFDINACTFVKEAYENKKWAFVSDYVRIYALYQEGGIYFDTDMKVIKDVSNIVDKDMFLGFEDSGYVGTAVIGVKEKNNKYIKEILDYYNEIKHFNIDIIYNYANPVIITKILNNYKYEKNEQGIKIYDGHVYVYPREYFYPLNYNYSEKVYTENTCMIHLFNATWTDRGEKRTIGIYRKFGTQFGGFLNRLIDGMFNFKTNIVHNLKRLYNFARMQYSIHINRPKRIKKIREALSQFKDNYLLIYHPENTKIIDVLRSNFTDNMLGIREQYTKKEAKLIAKEIADAGKKTVVFNGLVDGWDKLITELKNIKPNIIVKLVIYEGNELLSELNNWDLYNTAVDLYAKDKIDKFVFVSKNMYEFFKAKGYEAELFMNEVIVKDKEKYIDKKENIQNKESIKIGLYEAEDRYAKNIYNQLSAISLIENHELDCSPINYKISMMARKFNINLLGVATRLSKEELYNKMAKNDINLFISFPENIMIRAIESLELGTVCLIGRNNNYFEGTELEEYIVVQNETDIIEISNKIKFAIANKDKILDLYKQWKKEYSIKCEKSKNQLLSK